MDSTYQILPIFLVKIFLRYNTVNGLDSSCIQCYKIVNKAMHVI